MPLVLFNPKIEPYQVLPHWEQWQWRGAPYSPKLQYYWDLTVRLFSVIYRTLFRAGVLPLCRGAVGVFYSPSRLNKFLIWSS